MADANRLIGKPDDAEIIAEIKRMLKEHGDICDCYLPSEIENYLEVNGK